MTPDQNPHPLTDHDGRTSGGETPMPLVDDVALHQPALPTPPPLFRPKKEAPPVEDSRPGEGSLSVGDLPPVEGFLPVEDSRRGEGFLPVEDSRPVEGSPPMKDLPPGEVPLPGEDLDPLPGEAGPEVPEDSQDLDDPGPAPAAKPLLKPIRLVHPGRSLHLDQFQLDLPHLQPVRRSRTEPSAEWTPLPAYGEEAGPGPNPAPDAQTDKDKETGPGLGAKGAQGAGGGNGPAPELDLVLDLAPGARATSATVSVPAPHPPPHPRRHSVIAGESTASIPVHLLFRDDPEQPAPAALPTTVARPTTGPGKGSGPATPADRAPRPRSPRPRVDAPTRPAPLADPRLVERPGPALPGYAALLTGAAGLLGVLALLWWRGALPAAAQSTVGLAPRPYEGIGAGVWAGLALLGTVIVLAFGGLGRGRVGYAWVLTLFGDYRGSVRRTGLVWVSPLLLRRRVDVRLRHWRSEPLPAVDANGTALRVVVLVVWRIQDTVRAALGIEDHEAYLSAQVESAMARVLSQLPADAFHEDAPTLRDAEAVGDALTRMLKADCEPVGVEVYSAQPTGIEYAPEVAAAMQRRRIAAIDAKHRDSVLTSVVDAVDDTVHRLTTRGIVDLDDYERKALVKDLTVAFYTGRSSGGDGA
ncbi:SPFH domain-containing protein [Streptomyces sp. NPDC006261]|uniref:SPFH domain-containing protein n=1 Tax=Streptomyces sp. NPDC006261 TaxID=3156739 RepID=UPI0033B8ACCB